MKKVVKKIIFLIFLMIYGINVNAMEDATLKNIKVNGNLVECIEYVCDVEVDANIVTISYEKNSEFSTVDRASGSKTPIASNATISINVTSGDGNNHNEYKFNITKHVKSDDYSLSKLLINEKEIILKEEVYVYSANVSYDEETIVVVPTLTNEKAKITTEELTYIFPLDSSSKSIDFEVEAENGDKKVYRLVLTRNSRPVTTLKSLEIDHGKINFDKNIYEYEIEVEYEVKHLNIEAAPSSSMAVVDIPDKNLEIGENIINIEVSNGDVKDTYVLKVYRNQNLDKSLANLESLTIKEFSDLNFDPNVLDYTLTFNKIPDYLNIKAQPKSSDGKVEIVDNLLLKNDSKILVKVTLIETGITRTYTLTIKEVEKETINKTIIIISIIVLLIVMVILFILQKKEGKKGKKVKKIKKSEVDDIEVI